MKTAERIEFVADENGWEMHVTDEDGFVTRYNIHSVAWGLATHASETIGAWRAEGELARATRPPDEDEIRDAYPDDPKGWHTEDWDLARDRARNK